MHNAIAEAPLGAGVITVWQASFPFHSLFMSMIQNGGMHFRALLYLEFIFARQRVVLHEPLY
jgi:hypothetical protein